MSFFKALYVSLEKSFFHTLSRKLIGNILFISFFQFLMFACIYLNISDLRELITAGGQVSPDQFNAIADRTIEEAVTVTIIFMLVLIGSFIFFRHLFIRPVHNLNRQLEEMSRGEINLTNRLEAQSHDEFMDLADNYNRFLDQLRETIHSLRKMGINVAVGATTVLNQVRDASDKAGNQDELSGIVFSNSQAGDSDSRCYLR